MYARRTGDIPEVWRMLTPVEKCSGWRSRSTAPENRYSRLLDSRQSLKKKSESAFLVIGRHPLAEAAFAVRGGQAASTIPRLSAHEEVRFDPRSFL